MSFHDIHSVIGRIVLATEDGLMSEKEAMATVASLRKLISLESGQTIAKTEPAPPPAVVAPLASTVLPIPVSTFKMCAGGCGVMTRNPSGTCALCEQRTVSTTSEQALSDSYDRSKDVVQ